MRRPSMRWDLLCAGALLLAACGDSGAEPAEGGGGVHAGEAARSGSAGTSATMMTTMSPVMSAGRGGHAAGASGRPAASGGAAGRTTREPADAADAGSDEPTTGATPADRAPVAGVPGTFKVFDRIPQFGIYRTDDPDYQPPAGILMWNHGTLFVAKLDRAQQAQIGADLAARITYHAQCDNYDRLGGLFFILKDPGEAPREQDPRTELVRFITPFSDYMRGALATYVFPSGDIATYARTLADPSKDVWIGIGGGSNPYDGDPCTNTSQPASFKAVGFNYSLELISSEPLTAGDSITLNALSNVSAKSLPVEGMFKVAGAAPLTGHVTVIVSGHGAESGGNEYMNTRDSVHVNGEPIGSFDTKIDCASYARYSPDGNQGIFRSNNAGNPRNWCPGAVVPPHTFPATLKPGDNPVSLQVEPSQLPSGSYYATSITFSTP